MGQNGLKKYIKWLVNLEACKCIYLMCLSKKEDPRGWHNQSFIMLGVTTQGSHSEILTTVLSFSPGGWSPVRPTTAGGQVQSQPEVSSRRADQGGVSPGVQLRALLLVSAYCTAQCASRGSRIAAGYLE